VQYSGVVAANDHQTVTSSKAAVGKSSPHNNAEVAEWQTRRTQKTYLEMQKSLVF